MLSLCMRVPRYDDLGLDPRTRFGTQVVNGAKASRWAEPLVDTLSLCLGVRLREIGQEVLSSTPDWALDHSFKRVPDRFMEAIVHNMARMPEAGRRRLQRCLHWAAKCVDAGETEALLFGSIALEALVDNLKQGKCPTCKRTIFGKGPSEGFRELLIQHSGMPEQEARGLARRLYEARSRIAHDGFRSTFEDSMAPFRAAFHLGDVRTRLLLPQLDVPIVLRRVSASWAQVEACKSAAAATNPPG